MPRRTSGLSGNELAAAIGVTPNRRLDWARKGLLRREQSYGPLDAVDLACLGALMDKVGPKSARRCWPTLRKALRDQLPNRGARMWAVIDTRPAAIEIVRSPSAVTTAASEASGSVSVLAVHDIAERALDAFRVAAPGSDDQAVAPIHELALKRRGSSSP